MKKSVRKQRNIESGNKPQKVSLWQLFVTFFKTGLFTFGGGYAMIAILEKELVSRKRWITNEDMLDMLVIAESTPGVIAVNTATSVGFRMRGVLGAIIATLGVVLPSFVIITALFFVIDKFNLESNTWYKAAFTGIQACVIILIVNAFVKMASQVEKSWFSLILALGSFAVAVFTNFNIIFVILIGGALGIVYSLIAEHVAKKKSKPLPLTESERLDEVAEEGRENSQENKTDDSERGDEQ
ncbi:MAG: chromate transporter [Clostridiales bacterium]|nr:chromate transporter [Clostridiales bacterium]